MSAVGVGATWNAARAHGLKVHSTALTACGDEEVKHG